MQPWIGIANRVQLHDAAHFATVFCRKPGGVNAHGREIIRFYFRAKAGRTILCEWNAVDHKLSLIFRSARMQYGIALVQPSGLRVHQRLNRPTRQRCHAILDLLRTDLHHRGRHVGIDESIRRSSL